MAEKDGDVAYVGSDWNEGVEPWEFGVPFSLDEAEPLLSGTVFSDRGVYGSARRCTSRRSSVTTRPRHRLLPSGTMCS